MAALSIIGRAERVTLTSYSAVSIPAKVDTGADVSSVWASDIQETPDGLSFCLFAAPSQLYSGTRITVSKQQYRRTRIANSFGVNERRYVVLLEIEVLGRRFETEFTLANRELKTYPMLLGRSLLADRFVVDVTKGHPLRELEAAQARQLKEELHDTDH